MTTIVATTTALAGIDTVAMSWPGWLVGVPVTRAEISFTCLFFMRTIRFVCFVSMSIRSWLSPLKLTVPQRIKSNLN